MTFHWSGQRKSLDIFRAYLRTEPRWAWIKGITLHHTGNPPISEWQGQRSIDATARYYQFTKGWTAGPNLFLATGAPRENGLWIGTPFSHPGIHAGMCNAHYLGFEVVGNFDKVVYTQHQEDEVFEVLDALMDWLMLPVNADTLRGHRECLPNKTCPGAAINMNGLRARLAKARDSVPVFTEWLVKWPGTRVRQTPTASGKIIKTISPSATPRRVKRYDIKGAQMTSNGRTDDKWVELLEGGYVWQWLMQRNETVL